MRVAQPILCSLALAAIAGCAAPARHPVVAPTGKAGGTIVSLRHIKVADRGAPWRTAWLASSSVTDGGTEDLIEFIVRADDGATLSIVQGNETGLQTGDRVLILRDAQTRLARPG